jgi:hypothetical protein
LDGIGSVFDRLGLGLIRFQSAEGTTMETEIVSEVGLAITRQRDAALWVGPAWSPPTEADDVERISQVDWLAVWLETKHLMLPDWPSPQTATPSGRLVIEVPDHIEDVLGERFSLADVCPFFYLDGTSDEKDPLSPALRRRTRDRKIDQLGRLGGSVLLVAGHCEIEPLREVLGEVGEIWPDPRLIVILEFSSAQRDRVVTGLPENLIPKIASVDMSLPELLRTIEDGEKSYPKPRTPRSPGLVPSVARPPELRHSANICNGSGQQGEPRQRPPYSGFVSLRCRFG